MPLNLKQCDEACLDCIKKYKKKHELVQGQKFNIKCNGIPSEESQMELFKSLPEEEQETVRTILDPVAWVAKTLDWHCLDPDGEIWKRKNPDEYYAWRRDNPDADIFGKSRYHRPYQAEMLRCLHGNTKVFMADGTVKSIRDIEVGDKVVTYNENKKSVQTSYRVLNKWNNGTKDIYRVELNNGDVLKVTSNHPILSWFHEGKPNKLVNKKSFRRVYKSLQEGLSVGDKVYTLNRFGVFGQESNIYAARLMGYIVSDGYVSNSGKVGEKHVVQFSNIKKRYVEEFADLVEQVFGVEKPEVQYFPERIDKDGVHHKEYWRTQVYGKDHILLSTLRELGCTDKTNRELSLLNFAFLYNKEALGNFLNRCWAGDGCVYNQDDKNLQFKRSYISLSSGNIKYLRLFRLLLKKIGIYTSHIYVDSKKTGKTINLTISRIEDIERFLEFTGPIFGKELQSEISLQQTIQRNHKKRKGSLKTLSRTSIKRIEYVGKEEVWDIEVDRRHNFVADGVVVHNCTSRRKVFRIGRQAGKCLASGTLIQMADGTQKPVEEIQDGDLVVSVNSQYESVKNKAYRACNGVKPVYRLTLMDGREIEATGNHPFLSRKKTGRETTGARRAIFRDEWIETTNLTTDDYLAVPSFLNLRKVGHPVYWMPSCHKNKPELVLLGCMIADGNLTSGNCRFSNVNQKILDALKECVDSFDCKLHQYNSDGNCDYHIIGKEQGYNRVRRFFIENRLWGLNSHEKYIPDKYMKLRNEDISLLLKSMFGCDGWASVGKDGSVEIGYSTVSEKLAQQIISLLARFNIYASSQLKTTKLDDKRYMSRQITITRKKSVENFRNYIGILGKEEDVEEVYRVSQGKNLSYKTEAYEDNHITFIRVRSVEYIGEKMTWDLTVPETHNFIANNIVTHNTETIVVSMLYHLFTKPNIPEAEGFEIVVITPYQAQIDLIFNRMLQLIRSSPLTNNSLKRSVKAPIYQIQLHNESVVKGFTAGTKSGGNADAVRGQHAHMLVFDEADYLSAGDMDSALSIITNYPTASMWMSSTPSGKREKFYQTCNSKLFKEFYYSSKVNPLWDEQLEQFFIEQLTEIGFKHEVLAEFGEQEEGVFQNVYVQAAKVDYQYGSIPHHHSWTYSIGVDWNDVQNGTTIVVLGFNPAEKEKKFTIVDRKTVSREGWNQLAAMEKVRELNKIWKPAFIYLDKGHGGTQWEFLRKCGFDALKDPERGPTHPDANLRHVVAYDFGSKVEVRDPFTHEIIPKDAKPFLVESCVRRFEAGDIAFAASDEFLERQLLGYIIDRVTPTGRPVYKANDEVAGDHILDALMLAVVAFTMEVSPLGKPKFRTNIQFSGYFGEVNEPEIGQGDTVIKPKSKKESFKETRERQKPTISRSTVGEQQELFPSETLPAAHTSREGKVGIWRFDNFLNDHGDYNTPQARPLRQAASDARKRIGLKPRMSGRPRRKNI